MSTIASPRASTAISSRRTSTSTDRSTSTSRQPPGPATGNLRRNRAALRDYYNLQSQATTATSDTSSVPPTPTLDPETESELDKPSFDPSAYVSHILATEGLEGVMRVEAGLVSDVRTLDGEKKALVYDNYSKLIAATDTIRKMRMDMDPLTPATKTLEEGIREIAESARALRAGQRKEAAKPKE